MKKLIDSIISERNNNFFHFSRDSENTVRHLKEQSNRTPDSPGLYLVFRKITDEKMNTNLSHLHYRIENQNYQVLYFGKAGGLTKNGKVIKQGLRGRINNVVSDSSRNLIDIKRALYWKIVMNEFDFSQFLIIYKTHENPQSIENIIYNYLDANNLQYPVMNKKRGRIM